MESLQGKLAWVTGSTGKIGEAVAKELSQMGAKVITHGTKLLQRPNHVHGDLTDEQTVRRMVSEINAEHGPIDILVCVAGGNRRLNGYGAPDHDDCLNIQMDEFWHQLELNLMTAIYCCREVVPAMTNRKWGRVVTVSSCLVHFPRPGGVTATYTCAKAALEEYTRQLAVQVREHNVTVNCVSPSSTRAEQPKADTLVRFARPEEVASVIAFLCGPQASYVSGEVVRVNGGNVRGQSWGTSGITML